MSKVEFLFSPFRAPRVLRIQRSYQELPGFAHGSFANFARTLLTVLKKGKMRHKILETETRLDKPIL